MENHLVENIDDLADNLIIFLFSCNNININNFISEKIILWINQQ